MGDAISAVSTAITTMLTQSIPAPPPGSASVLAFQPIGLPVDPADFQGGLLQAVAATDALADVTAKVVDGQYVPTLISATGLFDLLLSGVVATASDAASYGQLRNQAQEAYYSGSTDTVPSSANWWDPAAPGWDTYTTSSGTATGTVGITPVTAVPWTWRVLPASHEPLAAASPPSLFRPIAGLPVARAGLAEVAVTPLTTGQAAGTATLAPSHLLGIGRAQLAGLASISTPAPVQASLLTVSFQYMMVTLSRSWWDELLVANPGWYLPGYQAGDLAAGSLAGTGGVCGGLPTAMVLVRDLSVSGSWTPADQTALTQASTFGPFSLLGRSIGPDSTVQVAGTQIIGWVVTELPPLPPLGDPALSSLAAADPLATLPVLAKGATGPFVKRAQALLGALLGPGTAVPPVTDTFDAATMQAVQAVQAAAHITATGEVDLPTWHQLIGI